jgi:coenzyme F420-0:L-glutamate ligase/coenzyme F420-1:gamma-L-glutamate ligase
MSLVLTPLSGIPLVQPGDDLAALVLQALEKAGIQLVDGDILVLAQKIVSKAEGRSVNLATITPSKEA